MRLTHLADYAVVILTAAAAHAGDERLSASALSAETGVPLPTAQKVLGKLAAAGLLKTSRGVGGGIAFARAPERITLADIIEAVEGPIAMTQCSGTDETSDCALDSRCRLKPHMNIVSRTVREALARVTLDQLAFSSPARPEERLSSPQGVSKARLEGAVLRDAASTSSAAPQHERYLEQTK